MKRDNFSPTTNTKICSAHFKEEDFERHFGQKKLKQGVIPSMFNFPEQLRKEEPKVRSERLKSIKTKEDTSAL